MERKTMKRTETKANQKGAYNGVGTARLARRVVSLSVDLHPALHDIYRYYESRMMGESIYGGHAKIESRKRHAEAT
eukprot:scaffold303500_cov34-Prasinocladus_malaysianus.AAC.1